MNQAAFLEYAFGANLANSYCTKSDAIISKDAAFSVWLHLRRIVQNN